MLLRNKFRLLVRIEVLEPSWMAAWLPPAMISHTQGQTPMHPRSHPHKAWLVNSSTEAVTAPVKQGEVCVTVCISQVFHPDIGHCLWPRVIGRVSRGVCGTAHRGRWWGGCAAILYPIQLYSMCAFASQIHKFSVYLPQTIPNQPHPSKSIPQIRDLANISLLTRRSGL